MRELVFARDIVERDRLILSRYPISELDAIASDYMNRMNDLVMEHDQLRMERGSLERRLDEIERMPFTQMSDEEQLRLGELADRLRDRLKQVVSRADELYYESHRLTAHYLSSRREILERVRSSLSVDLR